MRGDQLCETNPNYFIAKYMYSLYLFGHLMSWKRGVISFAQNVEGGSQVCVKPKWGDQFSADENPKPSIATTPSSIC